MVAAWFALAACAAGVFWLWQPETKRHAMMSVPVRRDRSFMGGRGRMPGESAAMVRDFVIRCNLFLPDHHSDAVKRALDAVSS